MFSLFSSSVLSVSWPPPNYDMPRTVITTDTAQVMMSGLKDSLGSIGNIGLIIMGVVISVSLIGSVFYGLFLRQIEISRGVKHLQLGRNIRASDRSENLESIIDDRAEEMAVNFKAKKRFHERYADLELEERIWQKELSYQTGQAVRDKHYRE